VPGIGTLTLLFTDLVGSTESLVALGEDRFDAVRDEHDVLVGGTLATYAGEIVKSTGDGYMATFRQAGDAVGAAAEIQRLVARRNEGSEVEFLEVACRFPVEALTAFDLEWQSGASSRGAPTASA
jgi:class 3 adenylate cyclase